MMDFVLHYVQVRHLYDTLLSECSDDTMPEHFFLQSALSYLKLFFTQITVAKDINAAHGYGIPHPTPNPTSSDSSMMATVVPLPTTKKKIPHAQVSVRSIFRNSSLASYLNISCFRKALSPLISKAPKSSMIGYRAGRHGEPFGIEDMLNGSRQPRTVIVADRMKRIPQ